MSDLKIVKLIGQIPLAITIDNDGLLHNMSATAAPTINDDSGDGYAVGSRWIDVSADEGYVCLDATAGAAVWKNTTYETEDAQDDIGSILTDSATIDFTYNDGAPSISAVVIAGSLDNSHISASAGIAYSKLAALTASRALVSDGSGVVSVSAVTLTELGYVSGVTSAIQTQLNNKQPLDATLTALAAYNTNGLIAQTAADTFAGRTITAGTGISVADGNGVAGNPTISCTITQYTDELAQDAVGGALVDSSSIDFTYNDGANTITAVVLPAGVDHDSLLNFVANEHVDHSSVSIITGATSGLSGGGDLTASRTLLVAPNLATSDTVASGDEILFADVSAANALKKTTAGAIAALGDFANKTLSNLTAPTAVSESLTMAAGKTVQLKNDVALQGRNQFDSAWIDIIKTSTSGQIVIGQAAVNIFTAGNLAANAHNTYNIGSAVFYWANLYAITGNFGGGTLGLQTLPSGDAGVGAWGGLAGIDAGIFTANRTDATSSRRVLIQSGNNTVGDSGGVIVRIGTAGGTRGKFAIIDGTEGTSGHLWVSSDASGSGRWLSQASAIDHGTIGGLSDDDHTQYALLAGRSGGQTLTGGTAASNNLVLRSTSNGTKGQVYIDETTAATSVTTGALRVGGGVGISGRTWTAGLTTTAAILPSTNGTINIGSSSSRFSQLNYGLLKGCHDITTGGTNSFLYNSLGSGQVILLGSDGARTVTSGYSDGLGTEFPSFSIGLAYADTSGDSSVIDNTGNGSVVIGGSSTFFSGGGNTATVLANGDNAVIIATSYAGFVTGSAADIYSTGSGSCVIGLCGTSTSSSSTALMSATNAGAFVQGDVNITSASSSLVAEMTASGAGSGARGRVQRGLMRATNNGSFVSANVNTTSNTAGAFASGQGAVVFGHYVGSGSATASSNACTIVGNVTASASGSITASGSAAFIVAQAASSGSITVSGIGSVFVGQAESTGSVTVGGTAGNFAFGRAGTVGISVTGTQNCGLFGQGSNSITDSVKFGETIRILELQSASLASNGDMGMDSGGIVSIYSNGIQRDIQKFYQNRNFSVSSVGNVGTGVDDLISHTLAASSLTVDGDYARHSGFGTFAANGNTKQVRALWNGTEVVTTGAVAINGGTWESMVTITRISSTNARAYGRITVKDGAGVITTYYGSATIATTWTGTVVVKHTGEATSNNDIVQEIGHLDRVRVS